MMREPRRVAAGRPIRVLHLSVVDLSLAKLLLPLIAGLREAGFEVEAACATGRHARRARATGLVVHPLSFVRRGLTWRHVLVAMQLWRLLRRGRFHVLHTHTTLAGMIGRFVGTLAGVPIIVHTAHGFRFHEHRGRFTNAALTLLEKVLGRFCTDHLFTVSGEDFQTALDRRIIAPERLERIKSIGVDTARFRMTDSEGLRADLGLAPDDRVVGFVGRLVREKGIVELVDAMRAAADAVPNARLLVVGDTLDSDRDLGAAPAVRQAVAALGLEQHVVFAGYQDEVAPYYSIMDTFVLPSWREGMPVTVIEAMAAGLPVVATDIRGCREEVVDGETGFLVPRRDPLRLGQAIARLLSDPAAARRMGDRGRNRAEREFEEAPIVQQQIAAYRRLVASKLAS